MRPISAVTAGLLVVAGITGAGCARQAVVTSEPGAPDAARASFEATLRADLGRLLDAQRSYRDREGRYADNLPILGFTPSAGVTLNLLQGDRTGFSAIASGGDFECAVYSGGVRAPRTYVTAPDAVTCRP